MRNGLIVTGVLGLGTVAVFGLAAVAAAAFPQGGTVSSVWNGMEGGGIVIAKPMPLPAVVDDTITVDGSAGGVVVAPPDAGGLEVTPSDAPPLK